LECGDQRALTSPESLGKEAFIEEGGGKRTKFKEKKKTKGKER